MMSSYLDAYELAMAAGVNPEIVRRARVAFRYINAMASLRAEDIEGFEFIAQFDNKDRNLLSLREKFVCWMAHWPKTLALLIKGFDLIIKNYNKMQGWK